MKKITSFYLIFILGSFLANAQLVTCCVDGVCTRVSAAECESAGGTEVEGTSCTPDPCDLINCCVPSGSTSTCIVGQFSSYHCEIMIVGGVVGCGEGDSGPHCSVPLPIELSNFSAIVEHDGRVVLFWTTETEVNNHFFTIEKSQNGTSFEAIANVKGAGTAFHKIDYQYVDSFASPNELYYRLKQTDYDGTFTYSPIISVKIATPESKDVFVYPNPARNIVNIGFDKRQAQTVTLTLLDLKGTPVFSDELLITKGRNDYQIDLSNYSSGVYILLIKEMDGSITRMKIYKSDVGN